MGKVWESAPKVESQDLTPEQLKSLKKLDRLSTWSVGNNDKVDILGVWAGIKPTAFVTYLPLLDLFVAGFDRFKGVVEGLGLKVKSDGYDRVFVGSDADELSEIFEISKGGRNLKENAGIRGRLLGYPETAVMAFEGKVERLDAFRNRELREESLAHYFSRFALSKEHYKEEVSSYGERLMLATEQYLPKTYRKIVKEWNKLRKADWF